MKAIDLRTLLTDSSISIDKKINKLAIQKKKVDLDQLKKEYDPKSHKIHDTTYRKKKKVKTEEGVEYVDVNRIGIPFQELITDKAVAFCFGVPPILNPSSAHEVGNRLLQAVTRIHFENKIDSFNRKIARELFRCTEVAELWYSTEKEKEHNSYGFKTKMKLKCTILNPWKGDELYPLFDDTGDMIAFSHGYEITDEDEKVTKHFNTYTSTEVIFRTKIGNEEWKEVRQSHTLGKIPVVYGCQEKAEWTKVQDMIERLETKQSNLGDTNDYHAAPKLLVTGEIKGFGKKGDSGMVITAENGADAKYLSWDKSPESSKLEFENLLRFIYSFSQTPDISFEALKGAGNIATETLKLLFIDAHLKVQKHREVLDSYLQRRINIIVTWLSQLNSEFKSLDDTFEIVPEIQPFTLSSQKEWIDLLSSATGGKALISQETAIGQSGLVDDPTVEYEKISAETAKEQSTSIFEPTV